MRIKKTILGRGLNYAIPRWNYLKRHQKWWLWTWGSDTAYFFQRS